ncbi:MAG: histone deacetylase, partial [Bacteroidota bacterium]
MLKIAYHPIYTHPLPDGHRFPMIKYELLPKQLIHEGTCEEENFFTPEIPDPEPILAVHTEDYYKSLQELSIPRKEARKIGFPLSQELVDREVIIADGTVKATRYALQHGIAMNIAGGTHHAYTDHGEAFCLL